MLVKGLQLLLVVGLGVAAYQGMRPEVASAPLAAEVVTPLIRVQVSGQVRQPGLYELPKGSRVIEGLLKAGGVTSKADVGALNLSRILEDGEKIHVPRQGESAPSQPPGTSSADAKLPAPPVSINRATLEELMTLPGIGEKKAKSIIQGRPYRSLEDLARAKGFGKKTIERLKPHLTL